MTGPPDPAVTGSPGLLVAGPAGLAVTGLSKSFGDQAVLRGVDLEVPEGSLTAILGPSGSGKTTLLRLIAGFERPDAGTVAIGGAVVDGAGRHVAPERRRIGYVPQEGALFPHLTVGRNVAFGVPRRQRRSGVVGDLLELVGMRGMGRRYPHQLSGGQQQRVALARALAVRPALVLLDEPFSALDPALRASVRTDVQAVLRRAGATALLVTHDQDEALSWADHVAVIREGRIGQFGSPEDLYEHPADAGVARFLGEANLLPAVVRGGRARTALGELALDPPLPGPTPRAQVLVRPEQVELHRDTAAGTVVGVVSEYRYYGHDAVVRVRLRPDAGGEAPPERSDVGGEAPPERPNATGEAPPERTDLVVRVMGGPPWAPGDRVGVAVRGPVRAWPAAGGPEGGTTPE